MKTYNSLFISLVLAATGCVTEAADTAEDTDDATGELDGPIFPEDELPQYSCGRGVALNCPSMINYNVSALQSFVNGTRSNRSVSVTAVAAISADGSTIQCQPASGFDVTGIVSFGVFLPNGVSAVPNAANSQIYLRDSRSRIVAVSGSSLSPARSFEACAFLCDMENPERTPCADAPPTTSDDAIVTMDGRSRALDMNGTIETLRTDPLTGMTSHTCKLNLPADRIATQVNTRPRDILGVRRGRFVRGFELTGTALTNACTDIANRTCGGNAACVTASVNECVTEFQGDDPCDGDLPR
jgi:hypothetical protein